MDVTELLGQTRDALTVKRVFGESYEREGVTVIPVAAVRGGGGGGQGEGATPDGAGTGSGSGGGFGITARPARWVTVDDAGRCAGPGARWRRRSDRPSRSG